ncbi:high affinity immunoglobulin gamma Fc receptor I-like [Melanotaenia boesemani]|uniref:high affinity immunoglobulin gamma Fc receptor I-like n=1 Tax=Melanotaenia boesemani TaxID=1250792 RepID=UPI001C050454|nr:high affinity immunoglobulin gamma Fc receptor I-like [Melanotaenia boesemani]
MEATALCIHMLMHVFILLAAQHEDGCFSQKADAALLHVSPERLQFFLYESFVMHCEETDGTAGWKVMRKLHKTSPADSPEACNAAAPSCRISPALVSLSGTYWCENEEAEKSDAVNVSVTDGHVILVIPPQPVKEGSDVILYCLENENNSARIADFYRDGQHFYTGYYSQKTINNVSKSDEGRYRCSISGSGESPESWLAVSKPASYEEISLHGGTPVTLICVLVTVLVMVIVVGLLLLRRLIGLWVSGG